MKWLNAGVGWMGGLPVGLTLINWGLVNLCSKVGFCFIISKSRSLAWLPCCNSISFSGFLLHAAFCFFYSQRKWLEKEAFSTVSSDRSGTVGDDVTEAYQRQHPHMHLPGLMFHNCTQKSLSTQRSTMWHLLRQESQLKSISERNEGNEQ